MYLTVIITYTNLTYLFSGFYKVFTLLPNIFNNYITIALYKAKKLFLKERNNTISFGTLNFKGKKSHSA